MIVGTRVNTTGDVGGSAIMKAEIKDSVCPSILIAITLNQ